MNKTFFLPRRKVKIVNYSNKNKKIKEKINNIKINYELNINDIIYY